LLLAVVAVLLLAQVIEAVVALVALVDTGLHQDFLLQQVLQLL
jgi:hypothetical protein